MMESVFKTLRKHNYGDGMKPCSKLLREGCKPEECGIRLPENEFCIFEDSEMNRDKFKRWIKRLEFQYPTVYTEVFELPQKFAVLKLMINEGRHSFTINIFFNNPQEIEKFQKSIEEAIKHRKTIF
jgi:hypothetical protein